MKLNALAASIGLTILGLVASAGSFAHSKAELDASAAKTPERREPTPPGPYATERTIFPTVRQAHRARNAYAPSP